MMIIALVSLTLAAPEPTADPQTFSQSAIVQSPTNLLAAQMLGPERARDVTGFETERDPLLGMLTSVLFLHAPRPINVSFCAQPASYVSLAAEPTDPQAPRDQHPVRVRSVSSGLRIALAPGCRMQPGQRFASVNPQVDQARTMTALSAFQAALERARARGRLPFEIECISDWDDCGKTAADARRTLAALSVEQVSLVMSVSPEHADLAVADRPGPVYRQGEGGQLAWQIRMNDFGTPSATLTMTKRIPPPF